MTNLADSTAAAVTINIDGKSYQLSPFTLQDQGELDRFVESYPLERASRLEALLKKAEAPPETIAQVWLDAVDLGKANIMTISALGSAECLKLQLKLSLRKYQPSLSAEAIEQMMTLDRRRYVESMIDKVNGLDKPVGNVPNPVGPPTGN